MNNVPEVVVTIDEYWLTFLVSAVLPLFVALVTSRVANGTVKALILIALNVITGFLTSLYATGGVFELKAALTGIFISFVTSVAAHFGVLKPSGVTGSEGVVQRAVPGGIGGAG
jgi:hypothetical protein